MSNTKFHTSLLLAGLMAFGGYASAQTPLAKGDGTDNAIKANQTTGAAASDKTRADVKADAKAENKGMPVNKTGESASLPPKPSMAGEANTRADVKAGAKMPVNTGEGAEKGKPAAQTKKRMTRKQRAAAEARASSSTTLPATQMPAARADVKAEAKAANKTQ